MGPACRRLLIAAANPAIYRAFLSVAIATIITVLGASWNLVWPARLLAALVLFSWWGIPLFKMSVDLFSSAQSLMQKSRLVVVGFVFALLAVLFPLPSRRFGSGWTQPLSSQGIFAGSDGRLVRCFVKDGQQVESSQPLFQLVNPDLQRVAINRRAAVAEAQNKEALQQRLVDMHGEDIDLTTYETQVEASMVLASNAQQDVKRLVLKAPTHGLFSAGHAEDLEPEVAPNHGLPWTAVDQIGRHVKQGTLLGTICSEETLAVIPLTESQLRDVAAGIEVRLRAAGFQEILTEQVISIVQTSELDASWQNPANRTQLQADERHQSRFSAVVAIPAGVKCLPGTSVDAVFVVPSTTVAELLTGWLKANLRLLAD